MSNNTFLLPGIPFTVLFMLLAVGLQRRGMFGKNLIEAGISTFLGNDKVKAKKVSSLASFTNMASAVFSIVVYLGVILFIVFMWGTLGWWSLMIGVETYLILALLGFIFTGKL